MISPARGINGDWWNQLETLRECETQSSVHFRCPDVGERGVKFSPAKAVGDACAAHGNSDNQQVNRGARRPIHLRRRKGTWIRDGDAKTHNLNGTTTGSKRMRDGSGEYASVQPCIRFENDGKDIPTIGNQDEFVRLRVLESVKLVTAADEIDMVVQLCARLKESNIPLMERVVHRRGVKECEELLQEALDIEDQGGMLLPGGKRRTPGGVFLRRLQDRIPHEDKKFIWDEQNRAQRQIKRQKRRVLHDSTT